ncbi:MAG: oligosaccharide flippase family protein [Rhodoferax sp.]
MVSPLLPAASVTLPASAPAPAALRGRMLRAGAWLLGGNLSSQLLRLLSNLVLTRLLLPQAFGLVAAVNTLYFALVMFSDLGVWQSVVKSARGKEARFLGTAWAVQLMRGVLLCAVVLLLALGVSVGQTQGWFDTRTVYADVRLPALMAVFGLFALLQGLESMKLALAQRELQLAQLARLEFSTQLLAMLVTLGLALATRSVWALVLGSLAGSAARTWLSHRMLPGDTDRPCWDSACAAEIIGFGKWIFLSSLIGFLAAHGEKLILSGSLSSASFGVFSIASTLLLAVSGLYGSLNAHLIFSTLSEALREGDDKAHQVYFRVQQIADVLLGTLAGGFFMSGHWVIELLYDARYQNAGWMFQWLGLGLLALRHQVVEQLMFARGQSAWVSASNGLRALSLLILVPVGFSLGAEPGALAAVVVSQFASWPVALWFKAKNDLLTWTSERLWLPALGLGLGLGWLLDAGLRTLLH